MCNACGTITPEEIIRKRVIVRKQFDRAIKEIKITCGCGFTLPLRFTYKCLYCDEWYCKECAEIHFGKTREEYAKEKGFSFFK